MHLTLRHAVVADAQLLEHWESQPHVQAATQQCVFFADWAAELSNPPDWRELFIAQLDNRPIGVVHIIDPAREASHYWGNVEDNLRALDIWIGDASDLNCGYGTVMMQLAHQHCFSSPQVSAILIDPLATNTSAHRFYERLGYQFVTQRMFDGDLCHVYTLPRDTSSPPPVALPEMPGNQSN